MEQRGATVTEAILGAAIEVHRALGPGLLESAFQGCLRFEIASRGLHVVKEAPLPVRYKRELVEVGYRLDLVVEELVVIEVKAVEKLAPIHDAQLLTYLRLSGYPIGLLLNFNTLRMKDGIRRLVHRL